MHGKLTAAAILIKILFVARSFPLGISHTSLELANTLTQICAPHLAEWHLPSGQKRMYFEVLKIPLYVSIWVDNCVLLSNWLSPSTLLCH